MMANLKFYFKKVKNLTHSTASLTKILGAMLVLSPILASATPNFYGGQGLFRTWSGQTVGNGKFSMGLGGLVVNDPAQIVGKKIINVKADDSTEEINLQDLLELHGNLFIVFGLSNYADLGVTFPLYQDRATYLTEPGTGDLADANKFGFGDLKFWGKLQYPPYEHSKIFEMTLFAGASIPSGSPTAGFIPREAGYYISSADTAANNANFSASQITGEVMMFWTVDIGAYDEEFPLRWHINYGMRTSMTRNYENTFLFRTGLELNPNEFFGLFIEGTMDSRFGKFETTYEPANDPMYITPGFMIKTPQGFSFTLAADFGLSRRDDSAITSKVLRDSDPVIAGQTTYEVNPAHDFAVGAVIAWTGYLTPQDTDNDGIVDDEDVCPNSPEDFDKFEDDDGCPDEDNDKDDILDQNDKCPNKAEDVDGFEDEDGCPDLDNDKDGIADAKDQCPNIAEDRNGFQDEDGCPDSGADKDLDGIPDISDRCPDVPEDKDGFEDFDGCPEEDNDKDGFKDADDKCPNVAETVNGFEDEDGCPDVVPEVKKPTIEKNAHIILKDVNFATGSADLTDDSFANLDGVIAQLVDNPEVHLQITGHTDDRGSAKINEKLSRDRAQSVVDYFVSRGIDPIRLRAMGMGPKNPIASNKTAEGRAENRRIEMYRTQ